MIRYLFAFLITFNLLSSNENIVKTSELELVLFKMAYESLLQDVKKSKDSASLNENDLKNINKKIEMIMNELFKDKRVLLSEINEDKNDIDLKKIKEFKEEISLLKEELYQIKKKKREFKKSQEKQTIVLEEKKTESTPIIVVKNNFKELYNTKKFHALKCFDYEDGSTSLSKSCKEKLSTFINKNKKAIRFELIPIMSNNDNTIFNQIELLISDNKEETIKKIQRYLKESLSRYRVINALDYINSLNKDLLVTTANYYVKSKNLKGIVFRAYYKDFN